VARSVEAVTAKAIVRKQSIAAKSGSRRHGGNESGSGAYHGEMKRGEKA